jgi:hypothetical protein
MVWGTRLPRYLGLRLFFCASRFGLVPVWVEYVSLWTTQIKLEGSCVKNVNGVIDPPAEVDKGARMMRVQCGDICSAVEQIRECLAAIHPDYL